MKKYILPTIGLLSLLIVFTGAVLYPATTGNFVGTFTGDGSGLTGIVASGNLGNVTVSNLTLTGIAALTNSGNTFGGTSLTLGGFIVGSNLVTYVSNRVSTVYIPVTISAGPFAGTNYYLPLCVTNVP
jgi:hypothetical protein